MKRRVIAVLSLLAVAGLGFGQRGRGSAGGATAGSMPQVSHGSASTTTRRSADSQAAKSTDKSTKTATTIGDKISLKPELASRLQPLLPAGMTMEQASAGFKNQGQFIAALHVSQNLGIPFADLQSKMTGAGAMSLGKAIQTLKPSLDSTAVKTEVTKAETEAKTDLSGKPAKASKKQS